MTNSGTALNTRTRVKSWIALGIVYLVWGSTYLAIRVGVGHLPPLLMAGTRYVIAGALLYPIARRASADARGTAQGGARPGAKAWLACAVVGLLLLFAGNGGVTVAETRLPSGVAALLVATVPLWMIVFAWPVQRQRVTVRSAAGLAIGLGGVAILVGFYSVSVILGFLGVIVMFGSAVVFERNLRRMGRAGWHDLTRPRDGEQSKAAAASNGFEGAVTEARDWFRNRFHRREN